MVLILSVESDISTDSVIDWLNFWGIGYVRINENDSPNHLFININHKIFFLKTTDKEIDSTQISSFWLRKNGFEFKNIGFPIRKNRILSSIENFVNEENNKLERYLEYSVANSVKSIGYVKGLETNKLEVLSIAQECGLLIPDSIITNNKKNLLGKDFIQKPISEVFHFLLKRKQFLTYTKKVDRIMLPSKFNPTLFQRLIDKKYELRVFYLQEKTYGMAIFSQNDSQTKVDFRKYNYEKPTRTVPYLIPNDLKDKIISLMKKLGLNTGSIDFIVDKSNKYYFLEVNPSGQYDMISVPCNYNLNKIIAQELIS